MPLRVQINTFIIIALSILIPIVALCLAIWGNLRYELRIAYIIFATAWTALTIYTIYLLLPKWSGWLNSARARNRGERVVALTFDDGPDREWTNQILEILKQEKVSATFFLLGDKTENNPEILAQIVADGHEIGNHARSHQILTMRSSAFIRDEVVGTNRTIEEITGKKPTLFRSPHGFKSPHLNSILKENNLKLIPWTKGIWDSDGAEADLLFDRFSKHFDDLEILLLHDGVDHALTSDNRKATIEVLPLIIGEYRARGYRFAKIGEL